MKKYRIAVYGTLRVGFHNHSLLIVSTGTDYLGMRKIKGYILVCDTIPYAVHSEGDYVVAEIYDVTKDVLDEIDVLEGHPNWYKREKIDEDGTEMYIYRDSNILGERYNDIMDYRESFLLKSV